MNTRRLDNRWIVQLIFENMYMQCFLGYSTFNDNKAFDPSLFVEFRKRLGKAELYKINEMVVKLGQERSQTADNKIWGIANGTIFIYDPDTDKVIKKHKLSNFTGAIGQWAPSAILFHPNGNVYVQDRANLYQIDPQTMKFDILEKSVNHLIMDDRGVLYFLKAEDLWQYIP